MIDRCEDIDLEGFVDGECLPDEADAIERHVNRCEACTAELEALGEFARTLRGEMRAERAPADLRRRVFESLETNDGIGERTVRARPTMSRRRFGHVALGALAASLAAAVATPILLGRHAGSEPVAATLISDFETFVSAQGVLDLVSGDARHVARWYASRLAFALPALPSKFGGNRLAGGRLCWLFDRRLAALSFEGTDGLLALYIMQAKDLELPLGRDVPGIGQNVSEHRAKGLANLIWRRGDLAMSLVGRPGPDRLEEIARSLSKATAG